jgi:hypothetical protein
MIDRLIIGVVMGVSGWINLFPDTPKPLTPWQLQVKAKEKSVSAVCQKRKKQSKTVKQLCKRWGKDD